MNVQQIELRLISSDIGELRSVIMALPADRRSGYLSLALSPTVSFLVEESDNYFESRKLRHPSSPLFHRHKAVIKKSRALLKLFNDNRGGSSGLISSFNLFQEKSSLWMNAGKSGLIGSLSKSLLPDIGVYFLDEDPIYMTTAGFSAIGKTKVEIESLSEGDFKDISEQTRSFWEAIGKYIGAIQGLMSLYGITQNYKSPAITPSDLNLTQNDFHSEKLYKRIASQAKLKEANLAPVFFFTLSQVNIAQALLPRLFPSGSNLLLRIQFLTAYHATSSLLEIQNDIDHELANLLVSENILTKVPNVRKVRNVLAHYGFREGEKYVISKSDALNEVIKGFSGMSKMDLAELCKNQLHKISQWTHNKFSKLHLKDIRSVFGDHT